MADAQTAQIVLGSKPFTLKYGWRAFTALADELGCTVNNIDAVVSNMPVSSLTVVLWAGLQRNHPDMTVDAVADLLDDGNIAQAKVAVAKAGELFRASMQDAADVAEAGASAPADPPQKRPRSESSTS